MKNGCRKLCSMVVSMAALLLLPVMGFAYGPKGGGYECKCVGVGTIGSNTPVTYEECAAQCAVGDRVVEYWIDDEGTHYPPTDPTPDPEPEPDPTSDPEPEPSGDSAEPCSSLPTLENFTISESSCEADKVYVKFTPAGDPGFYLHAQVEVQDGRSVLAAWCTGDASLCKAVGNGDTCSGTNYTGSNAWCYKE